MGLNIRSFPQCCVRPYLEGYAWRALGKVFLAQDKTEEALSAFKKTTALFEKLGLPHEVDTLRPSGWHVVQEADT